MVSGCCAMNCGKTPIGCGTGARAMVSCLADTDGLAK
jgi:hypothetical protein